MGLLRTPWTRQPPVGTPIDSGSPLGRGLIECFPLNTSVSVVTNRVGSPTNGASFVATQKGIAASFDGVNDYIALPSMPLKLGNTFTVSFMMRMTANPATARQFVFGSDDAASALQIEVGNCNTTVAASVAIQYSGLLIACTDVNQIVQNVWQHWIITKNGTGINATSFYLNGKSVATPTVNLAQAFADVVSTRRIGQRAAGNPLPFGGQLSGLTFWNRVFSAQEIWALTANPWQIFQPLARNLFVDSTSGPDITLALTGQAVSVALGAPTPVMEAILSGNATVADQGMLSATLLLPLTGLATSAAQGTTVPVVTVALTGQGATAATGTLSVANQDVTVALTGQATTVAQGSLLASASVPVTGQAAAVAQGPVLPQIDKALTGQAIAPAQGSVLAQTSVALRGQGVSVAQGAMVAPGDLTVALTGVGVTVNTGTMVGSVTPDPGNGKSGVNRMWLIEYYTKEFAKKAPVVAIPEGLTVTAKRKALKKAAAVREAQIEALAAKAEADLEVLAQGIKNIDAAQKFTYNLIQQAQQQPEPEVDFMHIADAYYKRLQHDDDELLLLSMVL